MSLLEKDSNISMKEDYSEKSKNIKQIYNETENSKYSILNFDYGYILYELGKQSNQCIQYELC